MGRIPGEPGILGVLAAAALGPTAILPLSILGSALSLVVPIAWRSQWFIVATSCAVGFGNSTGYAYEVGMLEMFVPVTGSMACFAGGDSSMIAAPVLVAILASYTRAWGSSLWCDRCW
jgi:hypothetical protein